MWVSGASDKIKQVLGDQYEYHVYDMDTKRIPREEFQTRADEAFEKVIALKPALVFLVDDNALRLLGKKLNDNKVHTVFYGINNNPRNYFDGNNVAKLKYVDGVLERPLLRRSIVYLKRINKNLTHIRILFDESPTSEIIYQDVFSGKEKSVINGVQVHVTLIDDMQNWKNEVNTLSSNENSILIMSMMHRIKSESGDGFVGYEPVANWTSDNTPIPLYGFWNVAVGKQKAIGGFVLFGEAQGEAAGQIAKKILDGSTTGNLVPVTADFSVRRNLRSGILSCHKALVAKLRSLNDYTQVTSSI